VGAAAATRATVTWLRSMLRIAAVTIRQFILMAARAVIWAATMAAQWLVAMGPIGWIIAAVIALVALVIANWDTVKQWTLTVWDWIWHKIQSAVGFVLAAIDLLGAIPGKIGGWFTAAKDAAIERALQLVTWMVGLPGRISQALSGLLSAARKRAVAAFQSFRDAAVQRALAFVSWVTGMPGRISRAIGSLSSLLYSKGGDVVSGLWNGIKSRGAWLRSTLIGWAKNMIPGPIAKALGISSPSKLMGDAIGRWIPPGVVEGAEAEVPAMNRALQGLVDVPGLGAVNRGRRTQLAAQTTGLRIELAGPADMKRLIRRIVQTTGRGGDTDDTFGTK
jgi:hypothetical protein